MWLKCKILFKNVLYNKLYIIYYKLTRPNRDVNIYSTEMKKKEQ